MVHLSSENCHNWLRPNWPCSRSSRLDKPVYYVANEQIVPSKKWFWNFGLVLAQGKGWLQGCALTKFFPWRTKTNRVKYTRKKYRKRTLQAHSEATSIGREPVGGMVLNWDHHGNVLFVHTWIISCKVFEHFLIKSEQTGSIKNFKNKITSKALYFERCDPSNHTK